MCQLIYTFHASAEMLCDILQKTHSRSCPLDCGVLLYGTFHYGTKPREFQMKLQVQRLNMRCGGQVSWRWCLMVGTLEDSNQAREREHFGPL